MQVWMQRINWKGVLGKGSIWNPSNCECKYYESCDVGEYLEKYATRIKFGTRTQTTI